MNDYDALGFEAVVDGLEIRHKSGGLAVLGEVMRPNQREFVARVRKARELQKPIQWIELKCRQFVSMTTITGAIITGDMQCNAGFDATVTAQDADSLSEVSQIYRHFFGRTKKAGVEAGKAERLGDTLFVAQNGSRIKLQVADEDLGRSGSKTHIHVSEAGYIQNWTEAWRSIEPALTDSWRRFVVLETTLRRNQTGDFRDFILEVQKGELPPWELNFTAWHANPDLMTPLHGQKTEWMETAPDYERELVTKHGLTWEQARWYYDKRIGGMLGSYEGMAEAYPTTAEEALSAATAGGFFRVEAMDFYRANIRPPSARLKWTSEGLKDFEPGDSPLRPHVEVWDHAAYGNRYRIGADCADADERIAVEGSENAAVVTNEETGHVVAIYHGYNNSHEFAGILHQLALRYNEAQIVPEWNNAGRAVVDHLRSVLGYTGLYKRERFNYGHAVGVAEGQYGFDTRGHTRGILLDRLQLAVNNRLVDIPSEYLLNCLKAVARNNGQRAHRRGSSSVHPDDGAIALALTTFGHRYLVDRMWVPKQPYHHTGLPPATAQRRRGGIMVERPRGRGPVWDPIWQCWR